MKQNGNRREDGNWSEMRPHEEFLELCAVSTTGELSADEQTKLKEHLATCSECRQALSEFRAVADIGTPLLSPELVTPNSPDGNAVPTEIASPIQAGTARAGSPERESDSPARKNAFIFARENGSHGGHVNWNYVWLPFAAAVLLTVALGIYSYQVGRRHAAQSPQITDVHNGGELDVLEQQLSDAGHEREVLRAQLEERDRMIRGLQRQINGESAELSAARNTQANLERSFQDALGEKKQIAQQQSAASQNLNAAQASLRKMQAELDSVRQQREQEDVREASLETQIKDLNVQLRQSQQTVGKQQELLADDRDIRELMGARDLYIGEVFDVALDASTKKPCGRIFYTKGKSLVFYAYDLDQQSGVKNTSTFQAWGQNGPDRERALNLGVLYQDSIAKKRWVLKFDDPRALEQINAVFVTVEPHGGSRKPSGKPLLFASLRIDPNHP